MSASLSKVVVRRTAKDRFTIDFAADISDEFPNLKVGDEVRPDLVTVIMAEVAYAKRLGVEGCDNHSCNKDCLWAQ
jgi:hypothetical protein